MSLKLKYEVIEDKIYIIASCEVDGKIHSIAEILDKNFLRYILGENEYL